MSKAKAFSLEAVQFVPVIVFAFSFLVGGGVNLDRAAALFVISGIGAVIITAALALKRAPLNPILLGTNLWLISGASAFGLPIPSVAALLGQIQAVGLYICVFAVGAILTAVAPAGFIGMAHPDKKIVRKLSILLLLLSAVVLGWSYLFIDNIRLGGGLPFILLNITRRMIVRRNQQKS